MSDAVPHIFRFTRSVVSSEQLSPAVTVRDEHVSDHGQDSTLDCASETDTLSAPPLDDENLITALTLKIRFCGWSCRKPETRVEYEVKLSLLRFLPSLHGMIAKLSKRGRKDLDGACWVVAIYIAKLKAW